MARADGVQSHAALEAGAGAAAQFALHFVLGDEIARRGRHMQEAVGLHAGNIAMHAAQFRPLARQPIGLRHGVDRGKDHRMIDRLGHALAHEEHVHTPAAQRGNVILGIGDRAREIGPQCLDVWHGSILPAAGLAQRVFGDHTRSAARPQCRNRRRLETQIGLAHARIAGEIGAGAGKNDTAGLDHIGAVGNGQRRSDVLLHQQDGDTTLA